MSFSFESREGARKEGGGGVFRKGRGKRTGGQNVTVAVMTGFRRREGEKKDRPTTGARREDIWFEWKGDTPKGEVR